MHGGVILFRGIGAAARRYVESDRSRADDYYLGAETCVAQFTAVDGDGNRSSSLALGPEAYAAWVDWVNPVTGQSMGRPRLPGEARRGSPRFAEMVVNTPKSLSIAAALHAEVSQALDAAQHDAVAEIQRWLGEHSVTRVGPRGKQEVVHAQQLQTVAVSHRTSRAGDPHRHIHFQIGTRVWAAGKWRGLDTAALFRQQGAIRALGTAVIAAHPGLAEVLDRHGLTLDPVSGEVAELEQFNAVVSKRGEQVRNSLERLEAEWEAAHKGETMGPVVSAGLVAKAWARGRPAKRPTTLREEQAWVAELRDAGYEPETLRRPARRSPTALDDLSVQTVANRTLDRCAAGGSAWTRHTVQEHATRIITEYGVRASPKAIRDFVRIATALAMEDCLSILPPGTPTPEHVAHLTSLRVAQAEMTLRDLLAARVPQHEPTQPDVHKAAQVRSLDTGQERAAAAIASADPMVVVEGAAGAGKTTMLAVAIEGTHERGREARVVAPTLRAAKVAQEELGAPATSVAALVHSYGWRWSGDGVWTRLTPGDTDPETGHTYSGPPQGQRLVRGERLIVDEAGMLDQDTAIALLTVCDEAGATVALVGDRAQLAAVGRGGVLDMAVQIRGDTSDMVEVHRFTDPGYSQVTLTMRDGNHPGDVFDRLAARGLIHLHKSDEDAREYLAEHRQDGESVTVTSNDEVRIVNDRIREERVSRSLVDDTLTVFGSDGLAIGAGDVIQTRRNNSNLGVANRQTWIVQRVEEDGSLSVCEARSLRKRQRTVRLPADYVAEHTHLSYAATAYGVQGATVARSHTLLTDASSAASIYVGMTRGRDQNLLHIVAENTAEARVQFIEAMGRDRADRGLTDAGHHARDEVNGLIADGPVKLVNDEISVLVQRAATAEAQAARWREVSEVLLKRSARAAADLEAACATEHAAQLNAERVRAEVADPVVAAAQGALTKWREVATAKQMAADRAGSASWFGKRRARDEHDKAQTRAHDAEQQLGTQWGEPPKWNERDGAWLERVTRARIDTDPRLIEAERKYRAARDALQNKPAQAQAARLDAYARVFGAESVSRNRQAFLAAQPRRQVAMATSTATHAREEASRLRALTPTEALARIDQTRAAQAAREARRAEQARNGLQKALREQQKQPGGPTRAI